MTKVQAVRRLQFCSGHRVYKHEGKCANLHGHNYILYLYAEADELDHIGRVIDFSILKEKMGSWIDKNWDHTFIAYKNDLALFEMLRAFQQNKKVFYCDFNPTAENMALYLLNSVSPFLFKSDGIVIKKIELYETENCKVEVCI